MFELHVVGFSLSMAGRMKGYRNRRYSPAPSCLRKQRAFVRNLIHPVVVVAVSGSGIRAMFVIGKLSSLFVACRAG